MRPTNPKTSLSLIKSHQQELLDAVAATHGYDSYRTMTEAAEKDQYTVRTNLGDDQTPFYVEHYLGGFYSSNAAAQAAQEHLSTCQGFHCWELTKNGQEEVVARFATHPKVEVGVVYHVELRGHTLDDIEAALEGVSDRIEHETGFGSTSTSSFRFISKGEEVEHSSEQDPDDDGLAP